MLKKVKLKFIWQCGRFCGVNLGCFYRFGHISCEKIYWSSLAFCQIYLKTFYGLCFVFCFVIEVLSPIRWAMLLDLSPLQPSVAFQSLLQVIFWSSSFHLDCIFLEIKKIFRYNLCASILLKLISTTS